jgi:hypothetical protein
MTPTQAWEQADNSQGDPFWSRLTTRVERTTEAGAAWGVDGLQQSVMSAEAAGGARQLDCHDIDEGGAPRSVSPKVFIDFVQWLASYGENTEAPTQFELYCRNTVGTWTYWTASPPVSHPNCLPAGGVDRTAHAGRRRRHQFWFEFVQQWGVGNGSLRIV